MKLANYRDMKNAWIVEILEGSGTHEDPSRIVMWVHDKSGKLLGKIDPTTQYN